jgi:hypothetical protein
VGNKRTPDRTAESAIHPKAVHEAAQATAAGDDQATPSSALSGSIPVSGVVLGVHAEPARNTAAPKSAVSSPVRRLPDNALGMSHPGYQSAESVIHNARPDFFTGQKCARARTAPDLRATRPGNLA